MTTTLQNLENEYRKVIGNIDDLDINEFIDIAVNLFIEIGVEGVDYSDSTSDMLLFQYGVYDWGDENGEHFSFDITRQICVSEEDEPYQLNFTLVFDPDSFSKIKSHDSWSDQFDSSIDFVNHIKSTAGYEAANKSEIKKVELIFGQC